MRHRPSVLFPLLLLALGACVDGATAPLEPPAQVAERAPSLAVRGERLEALQAAVSDARSRLLPALGAAAAHAPLGAALAAADQALADDDARALAAALHDLRTAVAAEREALGPGAAAGPDLDALLLVLNGLHTAVPRAPGASSVTDVQ